MSRGSAQFHAQHLSTLTFRLKDRVKNNECHIFVCCLVEKASADHGGRQRQRRSRAAATAQAVPSARASERRDGPVLQEKSTIFHEVRGRTGPGSGYEKYYTASFRDNPSLSWSSSRCLRKSPPPCLGEPRESQERVQLRSVEHIADVVPMVQILDIPVPQVKDQLVASLKHLDKPNPEQVDAVSKIQLFSHASPGAADGGVVGGSAD